jgi:ferredoxin-thioredoxin reductase catalytic chain
MEMASRKKALEYFYGRVVDALGYKFTPDTELKEYLLEQEVILEQKHGIPYCPCQPIRPNHAQAMTIVCPCIPFHREHYDAMKRCWCGLFVHKDVTDPNTLRQIPFSEIHNAK